MHFKKIVKTIMWSLPLFLVIGAFSYAQEKTELTMEERAKMVAEQGKQVKDSATFKLFQNRLSHTKPNDALISSYQKATGDMTNKGILSVPSTTKTWTFIFISTSMPEKSIAHYLQQANDINALIVLRGLVDDSLPNTLKIISEWKKENAIDNVVFDPVLFDRFAIKQVPSIVVAEADYPCAGGQGCITNAFDKITGDVSLDYALREFSRNGDTKEESARLLNQLRRETHETP